MGRLNREQGQLFYEFRLDEVVPEDHLVRKIGAVLDLSWVHSELRRTKPMRPNITQAFGDPFQRYFHLFVKTSDQKAMQEQADREIVIPLPCRLK
jgi:hypothetical protein